MSHRFSITTNYHQNINIGRASRSPRQSLAFKSRKPGPLSSSSLSSTPSSSPVWCPVLLERPWLDAAMCRPQGADPSLSGAEIHRVLPGSILAWCSRGRGPERKTSILCGVFLRLFPDPPKSRPGRRQRCSISGRRASQSPRSYRACYCYCWCWCCYCYCCLRVPCLVKAGLPNLLSAGLFSAGVSQRVVRPPPAPQ